MSSALSGTLLGTLLLRELGGARAPRAAGRSSQTLDVTLSAPILECRRSPEFFRGFVLVLLCYKNGVPQKGQPLSRRSKICAIIMRNVAIDHGWCRALRTGSTPRPEMRRDLGQG